MERKIIIVLITSILVFVNTSCLHKSKNFSGYENCIKDLKFVASSTPNPDKIVFVICTDEKLKGILLSSHLDSIRYSGGIFDTIYYGDREISPYQTENTNEFVFGLPAYKFFPYSQSQMDSIAAITFEKVEIKIFSDADMWILKHCGEIDERR